MNHERSFQLSRIYAIGWNAAKAMTADQIQSLNAAKIAAMNPYSQEDERHRWRQGFAGGSIR